ncbi:MAG: hypothetical protein Q9195_007925 [Heterodermia aff. obscurata]
MAYAVAYLEKFGVKYHGSVALSYKGEAIRAINANLDNPEKATSDETMGAVAQLASIEGGFGNRDQLRIHMKALHRMIALRGGLQNIASNYALHTMILWVDLLYSLVSSDRPQNQSTPGRPSIISSEVDSPQEILGGLSYGAYEMRQLTSAVSNNESLIDFEAITRLQTTIESRLRSLEIQRRPSGLTSLDYLLEICRLAAVIYTKHALKTDYQSRYDTQGLKARIVAIVEEMERRKCFVKPDKPEPGSRELMWALFRTGLLTVEDEEEEWFAERIASRVRAAGIVTWKDMEDGLRRICWMTELKTKKCRNLWRRVEIINEGY